MFDSVLYVLILIDIVLYDVISRFNAF